MKRRGRAAILWSALTNLRVSYQTIGELPSDDPKIPLKHEVNDLASPAGSDDIARMVAVVAFIGVSQLVTALARGRLLSRWQVESLHEAMTEPLDNPEVRDDELITCARVTLETILSDAYVEAGDDQCP